MTDYTDNAEIHGGSSQQNRLKAKSSRAAQREEGEPSGSGTGDQGEDAVTLATSEKQVPGEEASHITVPRRGLESDCLAQVLALSWG